MVVGLIKAIGSFVSMVLFWPHASAYCQCLGTNGTSSRLVGGHFLGKIPLLVECYVLFGVRLCAVGLLGNYRYHVARSGIIQQNKINKRKQSIRIRALLLDANNNYKIDASIERILSTPCLANAFAIPLVNQLIC